MKEEVAKEVKAQRAKRAMEQSVTLGIYVVAYPRAKSAMKFSLPFIGASDADVLESLRELSKAHPEITRKNVYKIGTYNAFEGKIRNHAKRLVVGR